MRHLAARQVRGRVLLVLVSMRFACLTVLRMFGRRALLARSDRAEDAEILILRRQVAVLERQAGTARLTRADRAVPLALARDNPGWGCRRSVRPCTQPTTLFQELGWRGGLRGSPGRAGSGTGPQLVVPSAGQSVVLAAVSGASGTNGDFTVSSLSPQGTWAGGGSSGDFTWSYPINVPQPAAGNAPQVSLDYDSSSVDGRIASTNNQFGMIGEGFTLSSDSYIERTYADCADDPEGSIPGKYDSCWAGQVVTMSLDGRSTPLVRDDSSGTWHEQADNGDRVQYLAGSSSDTSKGTYDNGYWVVTTPDGTRYFFGKNRCPGWAPGDPETNSVFTEPVYGAHSGDPCYSSSGFGASSCTQAWRWNLDFVIDPNGNAMAYYYKRETNYCGANGGTTGVQYVRAGHLSRIDYVFRAKTRP